MDTCSTCNKQVTDDFVHFKCPGCGKKNFIRCDHCREQAKEYSCETCGLTGP